MIKKLIQRYRAWRYRTGRVRENALAFQWLTYNQAELRRSARQKNSIAYGWEVVTREGLRYFSMDAQEAVLKYAAKHCNNPYYLGARALIYLTHLNSLHCGGEV